MINFNAFDSYDESKPNILVHSIQRGVRKGNNFDPWWSFTLPWLKEYKDDYNIIFLTQAGTEKSCNKILRETNCLFDGYLWLNTEPVRKYVKSWPDLVALLHSWFNARIGIMALTSWKVLCNTHLLVEVFTGMFLEADNRKDINFFDQSYYDIKGPKGGDKTIALWNRIESANRIRKLFTLVEVCSAFDIPILNLVRDPLEFDWNRSKYIKSKGIKFYRRYVYNSDVINTQRFDSQLWFFNKVYRSVTTAEAKPRNIPLLMSFSIRSSERQWMKDGGWDKYLVELTKKVGGRSFVDDTRLKEKKEFVDRNEYYECVKRAQYTFVIPSYWQEAFSATRFIESVAMGALPLVWSKCNYREFFDEFNIPKELEDILVCEPEEIEDRMKMDRIPVLFELQKLLFNGKIDIDLKGYLRGR